MLTLICLKESLLKVGLHVGVKVLTMLTIYIHVDLYLGTMTRHWHSKQSGLNLANFLRFHVLLILFARCTIILYMYNNEIFQKQNLHTKK